MNMSTKKSTDAFRKDSYSRSNSNGSSSNSNYSNSKNNNGNNERCFDEYTPNPHQGDAIRGSFLIPPPSRKYTTTNPGTLSPIYHLVYDLTAPTTVPSTTKTTFIDTRNPSNLSTDPSIRLTSDNVSSPMKSSFSQALQAASSSPSGNDGNDRQARDGFSQSSQPPATASSGNDGNNRQARDGFSQSSQPPATASSGNDGNNRQARDGFSQSSQPPATASHAASDKRRPRAKKELKNTDTATLSQRNNVGRAVPMGAETDDDDRADGTLDAFFSHSKQADGRNFIQKRQAHRQQHLNSWSGGLGRYDEDGAPAISGLHQTSAIQEQTHGNGVLSTSSLPDDKLPRLSQFGNNGRGTDHNSTLKTGNEDFGRVGEISQQALSVRQAINIWSERSKGQEGITNESNSHASYQQGDLDPNAKRAVFKRDGDCVRLFLVNKDNDNSNSGTRTEDNISNGFISGTGHSGESFKRGSKLNTSQRLLNKLGLLGLRGSNSKTKSRSKKDQEKSRINPISANNTTKSTEKSEGDPLKPAVSKKPLNRWDSIHVHTRQALASAANSDQQTNRTKEEQTNRTKEVSSEQFNTSRRFSDQNTHGQAPEVNSRLTSDAMPSEIVTGQDSLTPRPVIKGILVTKGKAYDTGPDYRSGQTKQNCVQFADDDIVNSSNSIHSSHAKIFPPQLTPPVVSSSSHLSPPREVIDRNKYIIKNRSPNNSFDQPPGNATLVNNGTDFQGDIERVTKVQVSGYLPLVENDQPLPRDSKPSLIHDHNRIAGGKPSSYPLHNFRTEESRETKGSSDEGHFSSNPGGGPQLKQTAGLLHNFPSYIEPHAVCQNQFVDHEIKEPIPGIVIKRFDDNGYYPGQNYSTNDNNIFEIDEASLVSSSDPNTNTQYPRHLLVDQTTLSFRGKGDGFENHSSVHQRDTVTTAVEWSNKHVDGEDTLRYRRTLREIGKKNRNLFSVDQSNQMIKQSRGDFNAGFVNGGRCTSQHDANSKVPFGVAFKPKPNLKPKITPRQKFEITHNRLSGKVASNLRHNCDQDNQPRVSPTASYQVSKTTTNTVALATPFYKESPRAKFERDRAARSNNNNHANASNKNINSIHLRASEVNKELTLSDSFPKRLNKSCDDLETDSDGYLKPSTAHKSHSTETLILSPSSDSDSRTTLSPLSKLSPRARFENSRQTGNQHESQKMPPAEILMKEDNGQCGKYQANVLRTFHDLGHGSSLNPVPEPLDTNHKTGQRKNFSNLVSQQVGLPSTEQRKSYLHEGVRSDQSIGQESERGVGRGGKGQYGTSAGERFLTEPNATYLSASTNNIIDTNAVGWSGADGEVGINQASDERQARRLFKSQAEWSTHVEENGTCDNKPAPVNADIQAVQGTGFHEGNSKFSSTNFATSSNAFVISNSSDPLSASGGRIEEAKSANYINVSHGTTGLADVPRPSQVAAVKKMSPDSVSSSGYESEHASSAIFQKNVKNINNASDRNDNFEDNIKHDNSFVSETGISTVQELKLRFGHNQHISFDTKHNRNNHNVPSNIQRRRFNDDDNCNNNNNGNNNNNNHDVLLSDDHYDESLALLNHNRSRKLSKQNNATVALADVNNNKRLGPNRFATESDTGIRYEPSNGTCFGDNQISESVNKCNLVAEHGFSDSQLLNSSRNQFVKFEGDRFSGARQRISPTDRKSPKEKKHHNKLEKVSRSMHEIIHELKLESGESQASKRNRNRRSRRCSKCQDNSSPNFCPHCQHQLDHSRDSNDSVGVSSQNLRGITVGEFIKSTNNQKDNLVVCDTGTSRHPENKQNRISHSISEVAAMLASKGLRIYEETGEYVPMKSPVKSPTLTSLKGHHFNLEAASYLIVPTVVESFTSNSSKTFHSNINNNDSVSPSKCNEGTLSKTQRQIATDVFAQRSISDSGASASRTSFSLGFEEDDVNNGAHSDGEICDDAYLSMDLSGGRPRAMSMDVLCSDGAVPDADDSTDPESSPARPQKVVTRLRRRRSSKGYVEWRTCSGWVGKTDMRLAEGRNSRGYIEWDTIWTTATPWKGDGTEDEHVYDVIEDESASQTQCENETDAQTLTAENATPGAIDTPPALPERTYINRLKKDNSTVPTSRRHSPHHHHSHHHHHHHHHHHGSHHHHQHHQRHQHQSHSHSGGRRGQGHHHRASPQSSIATPKLKSANKKPPPPAPPVQTTQESPPDAQNYAVVSKLKGYTFCDTLTSPSSLATQPSTDKSVIYSENYWHLGPATSGERLTSWQSGDVLDYIDGLHDSMSPKRRENIYILLNNKKTRAKFSESLEIESRLLSQGLLCNPNSDKDVDPDSKSENMDTSSTSTTAATQDHTTSSGGMAAPRSRKGRSSVSSTYV